MAHTAGSLPFHVARKAVAYIDAQGHRVEPKQPNAIKFERFIFDLLPHAEYGIVVEVDEERTFAPVKNAPGEKSQSPEIVRRQMINLHREWLAHAGCRIEGDAPVEISPLFALDAEELARKLPAGTVVRGPQYFH
jgi:UDP-N-acetylglucosamine/UDP-N-acetylgalactosamine diphosphorylase